MDGIADPTTQSARNQVAKTCATALSLSLPAAVDGMQDRVNLLYHAWPERMYVIDRKGKIAYKGRIGPMGFDIKEARTALERQLAEQGGKR